LQTRKKAVQEENLLALESFTPREINVCCFVILLKPTKTIFKDMKPSEGEGLVQDHTAGCEQWQHSVAKLSTRPMQTHLLLALQLSSFLCDKM
jgi:hypothetical protein